MQATNCGSNLILNFNFLQSKCLYGSFIFVFKRYGDILVFKNWYSTQVKYCVCHADGARFWYSTWSRRSESVTSNLLSVLIYTSKIVRIIDSDKLSNPWFRKMQKGNGLVNPSFSEKSFSLCCNFNLWKQKKE